MKYLAAFLLLCGMAWGQSTSVTFAITDGDGQQWNNGSYIITFLPTPGNPGPYYLNGVLMTTAQKGPFTGSLNGSGSATISLSSNNFIVPSGTKWQFVLAPNASAVSTTVNTAVTGASQNLSASFSSQVTAPRFPALGTSSWGYLDGEVTPVPNPGGSYFNVTAKTVRVWDGTMWFALGTGNGTVTSVAMTGDGTVLNSVVPGSPVTTAGTLAPTLKTQTANTFLAGPTAGPAAAPTFRVPVSGDIPSSILFPLLAPDGTAAAPSYSWSSASNTGWHFISPFTLTLSRNGSDQMSLNGDVHLAFGNQYCFSTMPSGACEEGWIRSNTNVMQVTPLTTELRTGYISQIQGHLDQFDSTPTYNFMAHEATTPSSPVLTGFEFGYFKAGKGWCSVNTAGVESCSVKTGTLPIVVTGDVISCPTCGNIEAFSFASCHTSGNAHTDFCSATGTLPTTRSGVTYKLVCSMDAGDAATPGTCANDHAPEACIYSVNTYNKTTTNFNYVLVINRGSSTAPDEYGTVNCTVSD
jgi:hypothetical protein